VREDWNATAEPCRSLAKAYQLAGGEGGLGPTDAERLRLCAYWRLVGRKTVEQFNLTALRNRDMKTLANF
jgi:hypothetical protein